MPFTFAHIGYILPIHKKWKEKLSITGLVAGSIAPDYDFLFRLSNVSDHIFQYDLKCILTMIYPLAMLTAILFHLLCRNIILENLPIYFQQKYKKKDSVGFLRMLKQNFLRISFSVIIAILLHLFLDFFGHIPSAYKFKPYVMQYTDSNLIGNIALLFGFYALPVLFTLVGIYLIYVYEFRKDLSLSYFSLTKQQFIFWFFMSILTVILSIIKYYITDPGLTYPFDFIIILITSSFIISFYLTCIVFNLLRKKSDA